MRKLLPRVLSLLVVLAFSWIGAKAEQTFPTDGSEITLGQVYELKFMDSYKATFTPKASGKLIQDGGSELIISGQERSFVGYGDYGQCYSWDVTAGTTYTISNSFPIINAGLVSFIMEGEQGIKISEVLPTEGSTVTSNVNYTGEILIRFNTGITYENALLKASNQEIELGGSTTVKNTATPLITSAMKALYASGAISEKGGETITLEFLGIKSADGILYNGDGKLSIDYIAGPKLAELISAKIPKELKSFYPKGDTEGIWTFTFDHNLKNDGSIFMTIICGDPIVDDMFYYEEIYPVVDGSTLIFDMTDKVRSLDDYLAFTGMSYVPVEINNIKDVDGYYAAGDGPASVGSYSYSLTYNYIKPQAVTSEFLPASGGSLNGVDEIEIWYNNADLINFDGVEFTYSTGNGFESVIVLKDELNITEDNNEMTILVKVPEAVKGHDQVTVKLYNMTTLDGNTYRIEAVYDAFVLQLLAPIHNGQAIASTGTDDFVFAVNDASKFFYLRYDFYNGNHDSDNGWAYGTELNKQANGTWTAFNPDIVCYRDFKPYMVVSAYYTSNDYYQGLPAAETYKFEFVGTSEPFSYSMVKFVSIDPEPNSQIEPTEDFAFTIQYDGLVKIVEDQSGILMGMGMGIMPFEKVEPIYIGEDYIEGYASIWMLYPDAYTLENNEFIDITIVATDEEDKTVEGNMGAYDNFSYSIHTQSNLVELTISPEPFSEVEVLDKVVFSYPGMDVSVNYSYDTELGGTPKLIDPNWNMIEFSKDDFVLVEGADGNMCLELTLNVTEPGYYSVTVPENYFIVGEQFATYGNAFVWADYTVKGTSGISNVAVDDKNHEIYNMQGIRVNGNLTPGLYIIDGKKVYIRK